MKKIKEGLRDHLAVCVSISLNFFVLYAAGFITKGRRRLVLPRTSCVRIR
jgi:hypothetical protein